MLASDLIRGFDHFFSTLNAFVWGWPSWPMPLMVFFLLGTGVYLTGRLRLINIRGFPHALRVIRGDFDHSDAPGDVSHFQALTTALSATVGVGNIAGVATAIHYGGPGALFWMWATAALGMTTKFTECTLALRYRHREVDGSVSGGPMHYIVGGLGEAWKPLAIAVALLIAVTSFATGNAIQAHTLADALYSAYSIPTWISGLVSTFIVGLVIVGGIQRIGAFTAKIIPIMAFLYVSGALLVLIVNAEAVPAALLQVVESAFRPTAAIGGFAGAGFLYTMVWGVKRGLFSNEAGLGSAPIAHAAAKTDEAIREGHVALVEPFIDTLVICTLTGLVILVTGTWSGKKEDRLMLDKQSDISFVSTACKHLNRRLSGPETPGKRCLPAPGAYSLRDGVLSGLNAQRFDALVDNPIIYEGSQPANGSVIIDAQHKYSLVDLNGQPLREPAMVGRFSQNGEPLTAWAFQRGLAPIVSFGHHLVTLCVVLFALSTAIGWSYYGERGVAYALGRSRIPHYRLLFLLLHFSGSILTQTGVWGFGDFAQATMALPNLFAILKLSTKVVTMNDAYRLKYGRSPGK